MKIKLILVITFFCSSIYSQKLENKTASQLDSILASPFFNNTIAAVEVYDLTEDVNLYEVNNKLLLRPASITKLFTAAAALIFNSDFEFSTEFHTHGVFHDSVYYGDIFIKCSADPLLTDRDLLTFIAELKNRGINSIQGNIFADITVVDSSKWGKGWMWDDDPYSFAPYVSAFNLNGNSISIAIERNERGTIVRPLMESRHIKIIDNLKYAEECKNSIEPQRFLHNDTIVIKLNGHINSEFSSDTIKISINNPNKFSLNRFVELLHQAGINFKGNVDFKKHDNCDERSFEIKRHIDTVLTQMLKESDNLCAESILKIISSCCYNPPYSTEKGLALIDSLMSLIGIDKDQYRIVDGSGLSFYNLINAETITKLWQYLYNDEPDIFVKIYNMLPIAGYDGTIKNRMTTPDLRRRFRGKTGTLSGISNLSGFIRDNNNHLLAVTLFFQNFTNRRKEAFNIQEKIIELLSKKTGRE
ncbi:D-alanyl-D-alanine carboxypeptidase/D-alanyl-D-alanine endopeptidase [Melioribacter sp. OK-6-Me]|uniref:D-alanyl-D-alanine carboxypeptidase/D-alanyl-D-alanine endopeptidase n=1 Tax=unclassified Melioribacter TaxID=2627329 RepID=UPI003EDAB5B5